MSNKLGQAQMLLSLSSVEGEVDLVHHKSYLKIWSKMVLEKVLMQADLEGDLIFLETVILWVYLIHEKRKVELIIVKLFTKDSLSL